jgi:hypothetical protein
MGPTPGVVRKLYISHFLSTGNFRGIEFDAVLFLAKVFPGTLAPLSVYALVRAASAIFFSSAMGSYIEYGQGLTVIRHSIVVAARRRRGLLCHLLAHAYAYHHDGAVAELSTTRSYGFARLRREGVRDHEHRRRRAGLGGCDCRRERGGLARDELANAED